MAEVVGLIASIAQISGILDVLKAVYRKSKRGLEATQKLDRVCEHAMALQNAFESGRVCYTTEVLAVAHKQLHAVHQILNPIRSSLPVAPPNPSKLEKLWVWASLRWFGLRRGGSLKKKLDDVECKLDLTFQQIMLIMNAVTRPIVVLPDDEPIKIGLDRADDVLKFLSTSSLQAPAVPSSPSSSQAQAQAPAPAPAPAFPTSSSLAQAPALPSSSTSQAQAPLLPSSSSSSSPQAPATRASGLHIVGIVGQGGLGKRKLLIHILHRSRLNHTFTEMAYEELGYERPDKRDLKELQSTLLRQLGRPQRESQSLREGQRELMEKFEMLQRSGESVCIAIGNVWRAKDLEEVLPLNFATSLPSLKICIMITSRVRSIVDSLSAHCGADTKNVLYFEPKILPETASRALLMCNANVKSSNDVLPGEFELIDGIFPLCGGLPLALKLAGSLFQQKHGANYWEEWINEMEPGRAGVPLTAEIDHILEPSFKSLSPNSQKALLDIGACLCGWRWEAVQDIVGAVYLDTLKEYSLIDCVSAQGRHTNEQVVKMHGLIRKLAATKMVNSSEIIIWNPDTWSTSLLSDERIHGSIRFLHLNVQNSQESQLMRNSRTPFLLDGSYFARMKKLQVLDIVGSSFSCNQLLLPDSLRFMKLEGICYLTEANIPSRLQQLELRGCASLKELPTSIYECESLRYLCIVGSPRLQGFRSYTKWNKLSTLWLEGCDSITTLPSDLVKLQWLTMINCGRMQNLPYLYRSLRPEDVIISGCTCRWPSSMLHQPLPFLSSSSSASVLTSGNAGPEPKKRSFINVVDFQGLSVDELNTLENLTISECDDVQALWLVLGNMVSLKKLKLVNNCRCSQLEEVPDEMQNLTKLKLLHFDQLRVLPDSICNLDLLVELSLSGCAQLQELPREIGNLVRLEILQLDGCEALVRLPNSLCQLGVLKELNMIRCSKLVRLPQEMGNMRSLIKLRLGTCSDLQMLPGSICELKSLKLLDMAWCTRLETLPENLGNLSSLRNLGLRKCSSLKKLPNSILNLAHLLSVLDLKDCPLIELPEQLQGMKCLQW